MDSNQSPSHFSNTSSPSSGSSSINISPPFDSQIDTFVKTNAFNSDSKPINSNTSIRSSSSDDGGFVSGDEEFETVSEKPVVVNPDEETPEKVVEGVDIRDPVLGSPEFYTPMPVAVATPVDDVEKFPKARVLWGEEVEKDGVVDGMGSNSTVGDGVTDSIPFDAMESFEEKPEILVEMLGEKWNLNESIEEGGFGVTHDGSVEVLTGCNGDKVADTSKLDEVVVSSEVGESLVLDGEKVEEEKKSEALNGEESSVLSPDSNQLEDKIVEPVNSELVGEEGVKFTTNGDSVVESIRVNLSEPGAAVVGETEVSKDQVNPAVVGGGFVNGSDDKISHDVEKADDSDVVKVNTDFENNIETSTNRSVEVEESEPLGEQEADSKAVVKISADGGELVSSNEVVGVDRDGFQAVDFVDDSTLSNPAQEAKHLDLDGAQDDGLEEEFSDESGLIQNSQVLLEAEDEGENHTDEGGNIGGSFSDGETDGMIFGSSEAAKQFIEELERGAGAGSHSGAESSYDQQQRIDGQIVIDSDEEADTDEEGEGKELFDSAALAALLKAATGGGSDDGNITITSQDGSRLFSIERPAGLGSSIRPSKPATRPNRSSLFTPTGLTTGGESENNLSEEDKKKLEKLQLIRVKFLRLVQRLGASPDESVAAQVLYRIALIAGRQTGQTFSLDDAKRTAMQLEAEGKDDLDFSVNILVLGKSGVGKSATINSIFGEEKALIDAFEPATMNVKEISGTVDGVKIKVFDTPGLKSAVMEQAFNRRVLSSIKKFTKKSPPDIVLYVDRLDTQTRDLNDLPLLKMITSSLGPSIWRSAIVTLTHAASAPPDGPSGSPLSYEVFVTQRSHVVQQSIGHAVGDLRMMSPSLMNPVSLVENHPLCRKNREGQKVLPNGQTWRPQLLLLCYSMKILSEASSLSKPQDPFDHRKLFGFRVRSPPLPYMLSSMLQTRAHPKLPSDQGIENGDSDIDLADLSDSDQEEEEDEYDQLPPFKPLRKSQLAKLSKEQRNAYFEEYDYRVKLLQKKQWREELKRMREMKKKGNDATANDYDFVGEDADQENGSAAPVSTPLPDMVLPPSFDSDSPAYRYRFLEPTSQFLARPVLDTHGWDHDCGYDGVNLEQSLAIASQFPAAISLQITKDKKDFSIHLDSSVSARHQVSATPPPRTLNVHKFAESRAAELETLHSIVSNRVNNDFRCQRNKRRRTTGFDNRVAKKRHRKRQKLGVVGLSSAVVSEKGQEKGPRRIRRRNELRKNPETGYCTSGDGTKRLRTHVWHAKRFAMTKLWGFHLPLGLQGRGRGSRALLKRFKDGVLIHDASYYGAVQLEGPQNSLLQILSTVLVPSQSSQSEDIFLSVLSGATYGSAMLHHVGAPVSAAVAPVTYMWRSFHNANGYNEPQEIEGSSFFRQLWVWIHAAAFSEGVDALKLACQKQMDDTGVSINCISLEGKLAKLEVMGSKAFHLLQKILHPVTSIAENCEQLGKCSDMEADIETRVKKSSAIITLTVSDPRALPEKKVELAPKTTTSKLGYNREDDEGKEFSASGKNTELFSSASLKLQEDSALSDSMDLWDASKGILPPVEENVLCMEKHQQQLAFFCLGNTNLGKQNASTGELCCRLCPILLLNHSNEKGSIVSWSIILPLSWVKAFWVPLISGGACAIGLREKHWIACDVGLPCFPSAFPDCNAYSCFMATKAAASDEKMELRPPAMRPVRVPIPPPWESVRFALDEESIRLKDTQPNSEEPCAMMVDENSLTNSDCGKNNVVAPNHSGFSFEGFVARTSNMLTRFLSEIHGDHLLLFPDMKNNIAKFMKDKSRLSQCPNGTTTLINSGQRLCFLRVLLHAYKGGVFEEGAVVCAPHYSDINLWTSRSDNNKEELHIPQSIVASCFEQQPSGKWELQIPKGPVARASHRWPIGFVTTGFVRGSKRPSAEALCEAILLARLREEQWKEMPVKQRKEIYVLVRNLRSTAYRLALATIVLEQQEDDLVFM